MTFDPRLLVPLSELPGPVPAGAPIGSDWRDGAFGRYSGVLTGYPARETGWLDVAWDGGTVSAQPPSQLALDLSPPPMVDGWPEHVDGLDVAAVMLARACGLDPSGGVLWQLAGDSRLTNLLSGAPLVLWVLMTAAGEREWSEEDVPALLDVDPTDPLAPRRAMATVLKLHPWRTP